MGAGRNSPALPLARAHSAFFSAARGGGQDRETRGRVFYDSAIKKLAPKLAPNRSARVNIARLTLHGNTSKMDISNTRQHRTKRHRSLFKTAALNHSATLPSQ